jgi:hypothetical protein
MCGTHCGMSCGQLEASTTLLVVWFHSDSQSVTKPPSYRKLASIAHQEMSNSNMCRTHCMCCGQASKAHQSRKAHVGMLSCCNMSKNHNRNVFLTLLICLQQAGAAAHAECSMRLQKCTTAKQQVRWEQMQGIAQAQSCQHKLAQARPHWDVGNIHTVLIVGLA